jgi:hypothetical protein
LVVSSLVFCRNEARFRRQSEEAAAVLDHCATSGAPSFLYYLTPDQLTAEAGLALVLLAERTTASCKRLLSEAAEKLSGAVAALAAPGSAGAPAYPRSALLHATFLAQAYLQRGDLEEAVTATRTGLGLLTQVQSPRGRGYLHALRSAMARRSRSPLVREFRDEFDEALSAV